MTQKKRTRNTEGKEQKGGGRGAPCSQGRPSCHPESPPCPPFGRGASAQCHLPSNHCFLGPAGNRRCCKWTCGEQARLVVVLCVSTMYHVANQEGMATTAQRWGEASGRQSELGDESICLQQQQCHRRCEKETCSEKQERVIAWSSLGQLFQISAAVASLQQRYAEVIDRGRLFVPKTRTAHSACMVRGGDDRHHKLV